MNTTTRTARPALRQITYNHNETVLRAMTVNHNETAMADDDGLRLASSLGSLVRRGAVALAVAGLLGGALGISGSPGVIPSSDGVGGSPGVAASPDGFGSSPGSVVLAARACSGGKHSPDLKLV
jgi:hypothetical protein